MGVAEASARQAIWSQPYGACAAAFSHDRRGAGSGCRDLTTGCRSSAPLMERTPAASAGFRKPCWVPYSVLAALVASAANCKPFVATTGRP